MNTATLKIEKSRTSKKSSYDDSYSVEIKTTKTLTAEEYTTLTSAIESISSLFDDYIDSLDWAKGDDNNG